MVTALALALLAQAPVQLEIRGNLVLPEGVYLSVLKAPPGPPTLEKVNELRAQAEAFLEGAGYSLANVDGHLEGAAIVLTVDEGQLEKVVFRGRLTLQMVRLKLALDVPHGVYNRPALERQLHRLSQDLGIEEPQLELVPSRVVGHSGPQVDSLGPLGTIGGATLVHPLQQYELHVLFRDREWGQGLGLDLRVTYFDGLELGVNYQGAGLLLEDDRWRVGVMGGAGLRREIVNGGFYVFPSRVFAEAVWYTPAVSSVRGFLWLRWEGLARQRPDLGLENYLTSNTELSIDLEARPLPAMRVFVGFGLQHFYLLDERGPLGRGFTPADQQRWRGFVQLGVDYVFDDGSARWDRRHAIELQGRLWNNLADAPGRLSYSEVRLAWQRVTPFGWHDLWLRARGTWLLGDILYPFEVPLGDSLRALSFGDVFVRSVGSLSAEFRFSLTRDLFKLGLFVDAAAFGEVNRITGAQVPRFGMAFGPSFHALIEGMFQLDLALSLGLLTTGAFNTGVYAVLVKVF
jgi:hypothetical protein